jgi:hypothetical protein
MTPKFMKALQPFLKEDATIELFREDWWNPGQFELIIKDDYRSLRFRAEGGDELGGWIEFEEGKQS